MKNVALIILLLTLSLSGEDKQQKIPDSLFYGVGDKQILWVYVVDPTEGKPLQVFVGNSQELEFVKTLSFECLTDGTINIQTKKGFLVLPSVKKQEQGDVPLWGGHMLRQLDSANFLITIRQNRATVVAK